MAHEITATDNLFVVRRPAWHGLGKVIQDAPTSEEALKIACLDWEVVQEDIYRSRPNPEYPALTMTEPISGYKANIRQDIGTVLGVVSKGYTVVQNKEAFSFTDLLLEEGVTYESAGSLQGGKRVWMLARLPETSILGDAVVPYLVFSNGHDGRNAVKVAITPVRVVCANTLNLALESAPRFWMTSHQGGMTAKLEEAKRTLKLAGTYMKSLDETAAKLADIKMTEELLARVAVEMFPLTKDPKRHGHIHALREEFLGTYLKAPDLDNLKGTGWGVVNAAADMAGHREPARKTATYKEHRFTQVIGGHPIVDKAVQVILAA